VRILIDECVHVGVKDAFSEHTVQTVSEMGWRSIKDAPLLVVAQDQFDVFVTIDRNLERQQNLAKLRMGIVVVRVPSNGMAYYEPLLERLTAAAETVRPGHVIYVVSPLLES
jgi:predicted nuclease of predicted toxin-antitoxin system